MRLTLVLIVIPLLSMGSKTFAFQMSIAIGNFRFLAIDRAFYLLWGGLMEASAKGIPLWEIRDFPQWDTA